MTITINSGAVAAQVTDTTGIARAGSLTLGIFAAVFGIWAVLVPIAGAVIAPGQVVSDGHSLVIRHEIGGVVDTIVVQEGEAVKAGDIILVLNPVKERAMLDQINTRMASLSLKIARLIAERDVTVFEPSLETLRAWKLEVGPRLANTLLADQTTEHINWLARRDAETSALKAQADALEKEQNGLVDEIKAIERQRESLGKDIKLFAEVLKEGWGRAARLHQMEREFAKLDGMLAQATAKRQALGNRRIESANRLDAVAAGFAQQVSTELSAARTERMELSQRLEAARRAVDRVEIRTETAGIVNKLHVNTVGSAVEPFSPLVEIVPESAPLLVEAKLAPIDIDEVHVGQAAEIVFSAFNRDVTDPMPAKVIFVSADSHSEERTGGTYYTVRLAFERNSTKDLPKLVPGMPVETYFRTSEHTLLQYLVGPISDSLSRAFR